MSATLAYQELLFINMLMMVEPEISPVGSSMSKVLSIVLIVAQVILVLMIFGALVVGVIMSVPSELRDSFAAEPALQARAATLAGSCFIGAIIGAGWLVVLHMLRKVVKAVIHGDPFLPKNVTHLRNIWIIIAGTEVVWMISDFLLGGAEDCADPTGSRLNIRIGTWFFIFIIATISEAFRHGAALRAEQELTI